MRLLVSSRRKPLSVIECDPSKGHYSAPQPLLDPPVYGITYDESCVYAVQRCNDPATDAVHIFDKRTLRPFGTYAPEAGVFDAHQALRVDDSLLICSTRHNAVLVLDADKEETLWHPNRQVQGWDNNHFNSLFRHKSQLHVVAHNRQRPSEVWSFRWPSLEFDDKLTIGQQAHNIWVEEPDRFMLLDSKGERIVCFNARGYIIEERAVAGFLRGAASTQDFAFIGSTPWRAEREARAQAPSKVHVYRRHSSGLQSWERVHSIDLGRAEIFDIRILDEEDLCHPRP